MVLDLNLSGFAVREPGMEVLAQGFASRALVLPPGRKLGIIDGMVLVSWGMVLTKTSLVLLSGGSRWRFWHMVLIVALLFCPQSAS